MLKPVTFTNGAIGPAWEEGLKALPPKWHTDEVTFPVMTLQIKAYKAPAREPLFNGAET